MNNTKLQFVTLPKKEALLEQVQAGFPNAKCKLAYGDFIDIKEGAITSSLDLLKNEIILTSKFNDLKPKYIFLQIAAGILIGFPIANLIGLEIGSFWYFLPILVPFWLVRYLLARNAAPKVLAQHEQVIAFLQEHYQGELAS